MNVDAEALLDFYRRKIAELVLRVTELEAYIYLLDSGDTEETDDE